MKLEVVRALRGVTGKKTHIQWQDRINNSGIRAELHTTCVGDSSDESLLMWFGHVCRMKDSWLPQTMLNFKVEGKRLTGRSGMQWFVCVKSAASDGASALRRQKH